MFVLLFCFNFFFFGGRSLRIFWLVCLFKYVLTCISTFGFLQMEKPVSNSHPVQFKGSLHVLNYYLPPSPVSSHLNTLGDMANSYCFLSWFTGNNYCPSPLLLLGTDLTCQTSSFDFKSIVWPPVDSFEHLYLLILVPSLELLCENCPMLILSIQCRGYSGAS